MSVESKALLTITCIDEYQSYINIHTACTKNSLGLKVTERVNEILRQQRATSKYRKTVECWIAE
ncbi:MAG: hypothetical protein V7785_11465 [Bermanella sp.]